MAPDRGAQGNALKTLIAMPWVLDPEHGRLVVEASGHRHRLSCGADPITQRPAITDDRESLPTSGTKIRMQWAELPANRPGVWPFGGYGYIEQVEENLRRMVDGFALFNPHATFRLGWFGERHEWPATDQRWQKWKPNHPTSSHWYELQHFQRLIAAYLTHDRDNGTDRLVSDFIKEFDGLSDSRKRSKILEEADLHRAKLSSLVVDGDFDTSRIESLLTAMKSATKPVTPKRLGLIGEDHLRQRLLAMGCTEDSFRYRRKLVKGDVPYVVEAAFGWLGADADDSREIYTGVNWSAAINNPFRSFGDEGLEAVLTELKVGAQESIVFALHLAHPRVEYTDRGKSALVVGHNVNAEDLVTVTKYVTKEWTRQRRAEERGNRTRGSREDIYNSRVNFTDVTSEILPRAYAHASGDGQYSVAKRQLFYSCREAFRKAVGRQPEYDYFAGKLLTQFINKNPKLVVDWKITADPRGTLTIPNCGQQVRVPCGTLQIDEHLRHEEALLEGSKGVALVSTVFPSLAAGHRYQGVLYIEKEGFDPLLREARIAERFDVAVLSCKGQSVVAARKFVDTVCAVNGGVPVFLVHDFDKSGFEIAQNLTSVSEAAREDDRVTYEFQNDINFVDFGLRLKDVKKYGLDSEESKFEGAFPSNTFCTPEEQAFLKSNRRVELNAFTSPQFVDWLETKLREHLPERLIPDDEVLEKAYRRVIVVSRVNDAIKRELESATAEAKKVAVPQSLRKQLRDVMSDSSGAWDYELHRLVYDQLYANEDE